MCRGRHGEHLVDGVEGDAGRGGKLPRPAGRACPRRARPHGQPACRARDDRGRQVRGRRLAAVGCEPGCEPPGAPGVGGEEELGAADVGTALRPGGDSGAAVTRDRGPGLEDPPRRQRWRRREGGRGWGRDARGGAVERGAGGQALGRGACGGALRPGATGDPWPTAGGNARPATGGTGSGALSAAFAFAAAQPARRRQCRLDALPFGLGRLPIGDRTLPDDPRFVPDALGPLPHRATGLLVTAHRTRRPGIASDRFDTRPAGQAPERRGRADNGRQRRACRRAADRRRVGLAGRRRGILPGWRWRRRAVTIAVTALTWIAVPGTVAVSGAVAIFVAYGFAGPPALRAAVLRGSRGVHLCPCPSGVTQCRSQNLMVRSEQTLTAADRTGAQGGRADEETPWTAAPALRVAVGRRLSGRRRPPPRPPRPQRAPPARQRSPMGPPRPP